MGNTIILSTGDPSRSLLELDGMIETREYGKIKTIGINETGSLVLETERATVTLNPELPPPSGRTDLTGTSNLEEGLSGLLSLLSVLAQTIREMRAAGRAARETEHQFQMEKMLEVAEKMRSDAKMAMLSTFATAALSLGMTACSVVIAAKSASVDYNRSIKSAEVEQFTRSATKVDLDLKIERTKLQPNSTRLQNLTAASEQSSLMKKAAETAVSKLDKSSFFWGMTSQLSQTSTQLAGSVLGGIGECSQAHSQADQEILRRDAEDHQFKAQKETDQIHAFEELNRSVLDKIKAILELKAQSMQTVTRV